MYKFYTSLYILHCFKLPDRHGSNFLDFFFFFFFLSSVSETGFSGETEWLS